MSAPGQSQARYALQQDLRLIGDMANAVLQGADLSSPDFDPIVGGAIRKCRTARKLSDYLGEAMLPPVIECAASMAQLTGVLSHLRLLPIYTDKHATVMNAFQSVAREQKNAFKDSRDLTEWFWEFCDGYKNYRATVASMDAQNDKLQKADRIFENALHKGELAAHRRYAEPKDCIRNGFNALGGMNTAVVNLSRSARAIARLQLGAAVHKGRLLREKLDPQELFDDANSVGGLLDMCDRNAHNASAWTEDLFPLLERMHARMNGRAPATDGTMLTRH